MKNTSAESSQRCKLSKLMNGILSDQLAPYLDLFDGEIKSHFNGTIIRIPLRTLEAQEQSGLERVIGQVWTIGQIQAMFRTWVEDAKVGMLFSKKLATIEIKDNIRGNADFGWCATKTVGSGSAQLDNMLNEQSHERGVPSTTQIVDIHVTTSGSTETESWKWLVHTEHELPQDAPQEAKVIEQRYQVDVDRGIAIPLDFHFKGATFRGRMLTRAPTSIPSGLPFHVFAHLSVTPTTEVDAENLAENHDEWNNFMIGWALPSTAINAFERLLQWMFRGVAQGGPKAKDITEVISHYFQLWPSKPSKPFKANDTQSKAAGTSSLLPETLPSQDPIDTFIRRFIRESFHRPVFLCRSPIKPLFKILKGVDVIFSGLDLKQKDTPEGVEELIRHRLRYLDFKVCDCPDNLQAWIEHDWGLHPALAYRQIDPDLIRELIRQDPTFTTDSFNSIERKCWILDYTMKALLDPVKIAAMKEPLVGLTLIPLVNGEWEELQPEGPLSQPYYTAEPVMRELISGADILVDVGLFNTFKDPRHPGQSTLEKILNRLVEDPTYCIRKMTPREFGAFICQENPQGISNPLRDKIWRLLDSYDDLEPFGDLHVLKTLDGATKPLRCVLQGQGLEISLVHDTEVKQGVRGLSSLLKDLGVVVVDATHNNRHRYFTTRLPRAERGAVLSAIGNRYGNFWPSNRILTMDEVIILRDMLDNTDDDEINQFAAKLGQLQLWESWESSPADGPNPPLIRAHGSYFVEGTRLSCWGALGTNSDLIRHTNHAYFKAMGAKPLSLIRAVQTRVIPQFLDGSLSCTGATKDAYIETFNEIIRLTTLSGHNLTEAAHNLLRNENFILARDGSFQSSKELFDPDDHLCAAILGDTPSKFPDQSVWDLIGPNDRGHLFSFRNSQDPDVVIECANYVLDLTQGSTELSQDLVYSKAITIVDFIYRNGDETNWMDPKWKIVPAEVASQSPYSGRVPNLPAYLSFKDLVDPGLRLQVWTQCAFFPKDLAPPLNFRQRFPSVGVPSMEMIVEHLNVLVTELAHTWKLLEQEEALRSALLDVYRALDDHAAKSRMDVARLLQDTFNGVPYIFEGHGALPSNPGSWFEPSQLLRGLSQDMDYYYKVPDELKELSWFLEAAGVQKMQNVNSRVNVVKERGVKDIENWLLESFQDQDQKSGFMDVKFIFADGQQISAHKVLLVRMSEHFMTRLTGAWSECEPLLSLTEINMSNQVEYEVFYGLLYYFYTDRLIPTNGPSVLPQSTGDSGVNVRNSNSPELLDRVQYLMDLLHLSDEYRTSRLTTLIVQEIVTANKVTHDNVFDVRAHAEDMLDCRDLLEHCNEYLRQNESTLQAQLEKEMESLQDGDGSLTDEQSEQLKELEDKQEILTGLLNTHV
ncbi:hypothetical protein BGX31_002075 [Mortierella sp. GBA43]|nr:hypothetical protein BGX31_002075 [Mortierella sp. GBA43]